LEYLHQNGTKIPDGFVIANDTDSKRAYMLTHQARRLNSPALLITNNDARQLPSLKLDKMGTTLKFDRILCDVPCSGDGTLRKNFTLWKNFNSHMGHALHPLQLEILERAFALLKKGGRLVYSTCTFNPIEDEAVVAAALSRHIKQIELVDVSTEVSPHLKYRQGLTSWEVYHRGKGKYHEPAWYQSFKDVPDWKKKNIKETMFNDTYTYFNNEADRTEDMKYDPLHLKRCMRIYPHD
jgi:16S rRNA C967 or C1407 C5-methylase (RsmB/RsmF family)